jgi:5-methylcytosine-specific restriction endonuclease McrA
MARKANLLCGGGCGRLLWGGTTSLPTPICRECRRTKAIEHSQRHRPDWKPRLAKKRCGWCADAFIAYDCTGKRYCSQSCSARATNRRYRPDSDHRTKRRDREAAAPGLSGTARRKLLHKWLRQQRSCTYCPQLASTVDHMVPLVRGGTNYEGNLVPACRRCNSSKAARLLVEWRRPCLLSNVPDTTLTDTITASAEQRSCLPHLAPSVLLSTARAALAS